MKKYRTTSSIILKTPQEIELMRHANRIVAEVLDELSRVIQPGMTTDDLDCIAEEGIRKRTAMPAFKGYRGFPATLCVSINSEVVHGIPSPYRIIAEGDVVSMDLGARYKGYYGDSAITVIVGTPHDPVAPILLDVTKRALSKGIQEAVPGAHLQDISAAIQQEVEGAGFSVVKKFVGHGIGRSLHEPPEVPNYGRRARGPLLREGMTIAIEPMVNAGGGDVKVLPDGWTAVTVDGSLSAHFEHTIAITDKGPEILSIAS